MNSFSFPENPYRDAELMRLKQKKAEEKAAQQAVGGK